MMREQQGMTLIEVVLFIIITGIIATGALFAFNTALTQSNSAGKILSAGQLANARMQTILLQRLITGVAGLIDPCASGSLAACTTLDTYATNQGFTVASTLSTASGVTTATVTVSGSEGATVVARFLE